MPDYSSINASKYCRSRGLNGLGIGVFREFWAFGAVQLFFQLPRSRE